MIASISISSVLLTIVTLLIPALKLQLDKKTSQHKKNIEEYKFIKEFTTDIKDNESIHPLVIRQGTFILCGDYLNKDHIEHLLQLNIPTHIFFKYKDAREFLKYDSITSRIKFKKEYLNRTKIMKWWYLISFYVLFIFPPVLTFNAPNLIKSLEKTIVYVIVWIVCWLGALLQVNRWTSIRNAEIIVNRSKNFI